MCIQHIWEKIIYEFVCLMGPQSLFQGRSSQGMALKTHPYLAPNLKKE